MTTEEPRPDAREPEALSPQALADRVLSLEQWASCRACQRGGQVDPLDTAIARGYESVTSSGYLATFALALVAILLAKKVILQ